MGGGTAKQNKNRFRRLKGKRHQCAVGIAVINGGKSTVASLRSPEFRLKTRHAAEGDYDGLVATLAVSEEEQISVGQLAVLPGKIGVGPIAAPRHVRRHIERGESLSDGSRRKHSSGPLAIGRPQLRGEF